MVPQPRRPLFLLIVMLVVVVSGCVNTGSGQPATVALDGTGRILIRNASLVLTMDPKLGEGPLGRFQDVDVLIDGDRIGVVGKHLPAGGAMVLDGHGKIVMPGFVDVHNHLWQTLIRGCATDQELNGWLRGCVLPLYSSPISSADGYAGARLGTLDVISSGVTTVTDWSHAFNADFARGNLRALQDSRLRFVFVYGANRQPATLAEIRRVKRESIDRDPLAHLEIGVHPTAANYDNTVAAQQLAEELGVPLNVHLHESPADPATGQLDALRRAGALRAGLVTDHTIQMTDAELDELAAHDGRVAHNPLSNMRLASGIARLPDMRARNMKIGLGLDGGTDDGSDMFADMKAAVGLQRAVSHDPARFPTPSDVLRMATLGGAEVLGLDAAIGSITPGKQADVQLINPGALDFAPRLDWVSQLVFNGQPANVEWVFVAGRALKRDGRVVGDQARVIADAQAASDRIQKVLGRNSPR
ncbi:MAG: amidohydrolase family protein [Actinobacteria bacterium]|nr:amidohydrolase family protein [Actinomycetota bacterium]